MSRKQIVVNTDIFFFFFALVAPPAISSEAQVSGLAVRHHQGQTFVTWTEVGLAEIENDADDATIKKILEESDKNERLRYRIYRSDRPITSVEGMTPIAEVRPFSCWNTDYYGGDSKQGKPAIRYRTISGHKQCLFCVA